MTQTKMKALTNVFDYQTSRVRVTMRDGDPWFVARDVCTILGITNASQAVEKLDEDEKGVCSTYTPGGTQALLCINEPGLYRLIFQSRKAEAKAFTRWVTHEVLPAIRKTGTYTTELAAPPARLHETLRARLLANLSEIPAGCFTIASELVRYLPTLQDILARSLLDDLARVEQSIGQRFARYARAVLHLPETHRHPYRHVLPNGRIVHAWAYDLRYLVAFETWLWEVYFPEHFADYERYRARRLGLALPAPAPRKRLAGPAQHGTRPAVTQLPLLAETTVN